MPRDRFTGKHSARRGAAVVELALLLPLLVFVALITCDFARVFYYSLSIANCARNGALHGCDPDRTTPSPYNSIEAAALADASHLEPAPTVTTRYSYEPEGPYDLLQPPVDSQENPSGYIEVTVGWRFTTVADYLTIPHHLDITQKVRMRIVNGSSN